MAVYTELTVLIAIKDGLLDLADGMVGADTQDTDGFEFLNDGKTVLIIVDDISTGAGDTLTLIDVADRYGRNEADLTRTLTLKKTAIIGPFLPEIWNQSDGKVKGKFTTAASTTLVAAVRVP